MTTQTEITKSTQVVQAPVIKTSVLPVIMAILLILSLISAVILMGPPMGKELSSSPRALSAWSARYQGLANEFSSQQAQAAWSARYQGLAGLHAAGSVPVTSRAFGAMAARYQGLADHYVASQAIQVDRSWSASAERYQALAGAYLAGQDEGIAAGWSAAAARSLPGGPFYRISASASSSCATAFSSHACVSRSRATTFSRISGSAGSLRSPGPMSGNIIPTSLRLSRPAS